MGGVNERPKEDWTGGLIRINSHEPEKIPREVAVSGHKKSRT